MLTMREKVARCCPAVREFMNEEFISDCESSFGVETSYEKFNPKTETVTSVGTWKTGTMIRNAAMKAEREYMRKMTGKIETSIKRDNRERRAAAIAERSEIPEHKRGQDEQFEIDFGDVDQDLVDSAYWEFAIKMEKQAPGFLESIA